MAFNMMGEIFQTVLQFEMYTSKTIGLENSYWTTIRRGYLVHYYVCSSIVSNPYTMSVIHYLVE